MYDIFSINDKVIIVTGGGSGLGKIVSLGLVNYGAIVYCFDKKFENKNKKISDRIFQINCDITDTEKFENSCKKIFQKHGKIDSLLNIAGIGLSDNSKFYSLKKWNETISVNLTSAFNCSHIVIKYMMKKRRGSIVNFTSINAEMAFPHNPAYVAAKGGLKMLGKSLAKDWASYGIRVNNIGPGYFRTNMTEKSFINKKLRNEREKRTMLGRWGNKEELIGPCIFLISDASSYITGQDIYVDGGWISNGLS